MLVMTAKVDTKKIILALGALIVAIVLILSLAGGDDAEATAATPISGATNDERVQFLKDFGWDVTTAPTESMEVKIPKDDSDVFTRYNGLQRSQGFDLSQYAGKKVMRYVYQVNNYPNATEPVYATVLVYKDRIIGGDITNTAPGGKIQGFAMGSQP